MIIIVVMYNNSSSNNNDNDNIIIIHTVRESTGDNPGDLTPYERAAATLEGTKRVPRNGGRKQQLVPSCYSQFCTSSKP